MEVDPKTGLIIRAHPSEVPRDKDEAIQLWTPPQLDTPARPELLKPNGPGFWGILANLLRGGGNETDPEGVMRTIREPRSTVDAVDAVEVSLTNQPPNSYIKVLSGVERNIPQQTRPHKSQRI